jgi:antitoxin (DNA-binding transcriptional repressor) of toxin-antitoxin stability system
MKAVGIRDLKSRLSEYLRMVRRGEEILITDRGEVVAELRQPNRSASELRYPALALYARQGKVLVGEPNSPGLYAANPRIAEDGTAARLLSEERGDR